MRSGIRPGGVFPDYALPDHTGVVRSLRDLQGRDPLVVLLARGRHSPEEHQHHRLLAGFQSTAAVARTGLVTISTDAGPELAGFRASVGARWTFLSDPGRVVQRDLDIQDYTDPVHDPMVPHALVLGPGLVIHTVYPGHCFWGRPSVDDLWLDLRALTRQIRPDWDPGAPGLRAAWDAGDRSAFPATGGGPRAAGGGS